MTFDDGGSVKALAGINPSVIYHCAGVADVHASWRSPARALRVNAVGTQHLLDAARDLGLSCPVIVTSSALVYRPSIQPITEGSIVSLPAKFCVLMPMVFKRLPTSSSSASETLNAI